MKRKLFLLGLGALLGIAVPLGASAWGPYGFPGTPFSGPYAPPIPATAPGFTGMRVERGMNEAGYFVKIHLSGIDPQAVQVTPEGRSLVISSDQSVQTEQRYDDVGYSVYHSRGSLKRRMSVPRDADLEHMQRTNTEDAVLIVLPRKSIQSR